MEPPPPVSRNSQIPRNSSTDVQLQIRVIITRITKVSLPIFYRGEIIDGLRFRLDLVVEDIVIVELKSVKKVEPVHKKQLLTYLRLAKKPLGLLINFNEPFSPCSL
ncbi:MAG: GxxExxY protein [Deltaproteobacteria bacterium]|nr:MAG: GxxExxY protein [Deltaproteobacteria bacterium]